MRACGKCHRDAPAGALFCPFCGGAITAIFPGAAPDPLIGTTIAGKYFVHQLLGHGGMGDVYKATHLTLDRPVAVKLLRKSLCAEPEIVHRFHREARAASRLNHPNSITIIDFGETQDERLFIAMEYLSGRSLASVIAEQGPLPEARVVHIGAQILAALAEAHALGIIHRDLKPANVMLEPRRDDPEFVKVLDFGIAKLNEPGERATQLTRAGMVCGTPGYMSPEQVRGEELDARSDLYAVGVILYEMLAACEPFEAETPMALCTKHLVEEPPLISQRRPGISVSQDLETLLRGALAKDPAARPGSADDMRAQLLACDFRPLVVVRPTPPAVAKRTEVFGPPQPGRPLTPARASATTADPATPHPATPHPATPRPATPMPATPRPATPRDVDARVAAAATGDDDASSRREASSTTTASASLSPMPSPATVRLPTPRASPIPDAPASPDPQRDAAAPQDDVAAAERDAVVAAGASRRPRRTFTGVAIAAAAATALAIFWPRPPPPPPAPADLTRPAIVAVAPAANAVDVAPGAAVSITFSEPMRTESLRLHTDPPSRLSEAVWSPDAVTVTATPERPLEMGTRYTVLVEGTDRAGNPLDVSRLEFTTQRRSEPPVPPPAVVETSPVNESRRIDPKAPVRIRFSRQMDRASVVLKLNGRAVASARWTDDDTVATFTPTLAEDTRFDAEIWGTDRGGRALGPVMPVTFSFRTAPRKEVSPAPPPPPPPAPPAPRILERRAGLTTIPTPTADTGEAVIAIDATPWATVFVNDQKVMETPCSIRVTAASYRIRAEYLSRQAQVKNVTVAAGAREVWTVSFAR